MLIILSMLIITNRFFIWKNGFTPLHSAAQYNSKEAAKLLIGYGANVNFPAKVRYNCYY